MTEVKNNENDEITIAYIYQKILLVRNLLFKKWKFIVLFALFCASIGVVLSFLIKPKYAAKLTFMIDDASKSGPLSGLMSLATQFGAGTGGGESFSEDNLIEILKARSIFDMAMLDSVNQNGKKDLLANYYIQFNNLKDVWADNYKLKNFKFKNPAIPQNADIQDSLLGVFYNLIQKDLAVDKEGELTSIVSVSYISKNEWFAKKFTEVLVNSVSNYYVLLKTKKIRNTVDLIQYRADSIQIALLTAEYNLAKWRDSRKMVVKMVGSVEESKMSRDVMILNVIFSEIVKQLETAKITLLDQTPLIQVIDRPMLPLLKKRLTMLKAIIVGLILGCLLGSSYVIIRKNSDKSE